jgi:hypothetical protein
VRSLHSPCAHPPQIGVHNPFTDGPLPADPAPAAPAAAPAAARGPAAAPGPAAALAALRAAVSRHKPWRGLLKAALRPQGPQRGARRASAPPPPADAVARRQAYALMALHGLLGVPVASSGAGGADGGAGAWAARREALKALLPTEMLARRMAADVLAATKPAKSPTTVRLPASGPRGACGLPLPRAQAPHKCSPLRRSPIPRPSPRASGSGRWPRCLTYCQSRASPSGCCRGGCSCRRRRATTS